MRMHLLSALVISGAIAGCSSTRGAEPGGANDDAGSKTETSSDVGTDTAVVTDAQPDSSATDGASDGATSVGVATDPETVRRRLKALDGVMRKLSSIGKTTAAPTDRLTKLSTEAMAVTDVASFTIDVGGLDATVKLWNGEELVISEGMDPTGTVTGTPPPPSPLPLEYGIPATKKAIVLQMRGLSDEGYKAFADIESYLTKAGYETSHGTPELAFLRSSIHDYSVVYINTHGQDGGIWTEQAVTDGTGMPMEWPDQDVPTTDYDTDSEMKNSSERDAQIASERVDGQLGMMSAKYYNATEGAWKWAARYVIKPSFIVKNWTLEKHALVHFDACHTAESTKLSDAVTSPSVGADVFVGWVHPAPYPECYRASQRFFDDVLGTNLYSTLAEPQRPFDVDTAYDYMNSIGLNHIVTKYDNATMTKISKGSPLILVPSIEHIEVAPIASSFSVFGEFGPSPGKITVGGVETTCSGWSSTKLGPCSLPKIGSPGAYGPVVVDYDGRKSNPVPITHWTGTLSYHESASSLDEKIDLTFHLRADVHRYRTKPRETPHDAKSAMTLFADGDGATKCAWSYAAGPCVGSGTIPFATGSTPYCALEVKFDASLPEAKRFSLQPLMTGAMVSCGSGASTLAGDFYADPYLPDESVVSGSTTGNWFWAGLDPVTWAIEARDIPKTLGTASFDMKWPAIVPDSPPTSTDAR